MEISRETPNLAKIAQKYRTLYLKTSARFIVTGDIIRHKNIFCATLSTAILVIVTCS